MSHLWSSGDCRKWSSWSSSWQEGRPLNSLLATWQQAVSSVQWTSTTTGRGPLVGSSEFSCCRRQEADEKAGKVIVRTAHLTMCIPTYSICTSLSIRGTFPVEVTVMLLATPTPFSAPPTHLGSDFAVKSPHSVVLSSTFTTALDLEGEGDALPFYLDWLMRPAFSQHTATPHTKRIPTVLVHLGGKLVATGVHHNLTATWRRQE